MKEDTQNIKLSLLWLLLVAIGGFTISWWLPTEINTLFPWQIDRLTLLIWALAAWAITTLSAVLLLRRRSPADGGQMAAVLLLALVMGGYIFAYTTLSIDRHQSFNSTGYDLAINEQIVWNTLNGRFFASSPEVDNSFADHFRPMLAILLPVYALFQTPLTLLVVQTVVLASGAIPLYLFGRKRNLPPFAALAVSTIYLLYPALGYINRFDFHIEVFAIPAFIAAFYAIENESWRWASFWLVIPLLCKENMGLTVAFVALYVLLTKRQFKFAAGWFVIGIFMFFATSFWLIPTVRGESADTLMRYAHLGDSASAMAASLVTSPQTALKFATQPNRLYSLTQQFLPTGFIALLGAPALLPALPGLGLNLLADHHCQPMIYCQYTAPVLPFIFLAFVGGLGWFRPKSATILSVSLVALSAFALYIDNPFTESVALPSASETIGNAETVRQALAIVPSDGILVTTNDYAPHLAQRERLFIIGIPAQRIAPTDPDIVFINLYDQQYIICDQYRAYVEQLDRSAYGVTFRTGGLIVIEKDAGANDTFRDFVENWNNCAG